jgi:hypothetical protein
MPDPTGGVSGPAVTDRPPSGPKERISSGGAGADLDHIDPECSGDPGEGQMARRVLQVLQTRPGAITW